MAQTNIMHELSWKPLPKDVSMRSLAVGLAKADNPLGITVYELPQWVWKNQHMRQEFFMAEKHQRNLVRRIMQTWAEAADSLTEPDLAENLDIWVNWLVQCALFSFTKDGEVWHNAPQSFPDRLYALTRYNVKTDTDTKVYITPMTYENLFRAKPWLTNPNNVFQVESNFGGKDKKRRPSRRRKGSAERQPEMRVVDGLPADKVYSRMSEDEIRQKMQIYCKEAGVTQSYDMASFELMVRLEDELLHLMRTGVYDPDEYTKKHNLLNQVREKLGLKRKQQDESSKIEYGSIAQAVEIYDAVIDTGLFASLEILWAEEELKMVARKADRMRPDGKPEIEDMHVRVLMNMSLDEITESLKSKDINPFDPPNPEIRRLEERIDGKVDEIIAGSSAVDVKKKYSNEQLVRRACKAIWWLRRNPIGASYFLFGIWLRAPHQRISVRAAFRYRNVILMLSRGMSKTFMLGLIANLKTSVSRNATGIVLGQGLRQGHLVFEKAMEPQITGTLEGQKKRGFARRSLRDPKSVIARGSKDIYTVTYGTGFTSETQTGPLGTRGTNSALRGLRANSFLELDEAADIGEEVHKSVIRPFRNVTTGFGREHVLTKQQFLNLQAGTVRYEWQRYSQSIKEHVDKIAEGSKDHCVVEFNFEDAFYTGTDGKVHYLFPINIEEIVADRNSDESLGDESVWLAENKNIIIAQADSEYPTQLIDAIRHFQIAEPEEGKEIFLSPILSTSDPVIIGIDPARERADFAIVVIRVGPISVFADPVPYDHVIYAKTLYKKPFQEMADCIFQTLDMFPGCIKIVMDQGGGGSALRDLILTPLDPARPPVYDPDAYDSKNPVPKSLENDGMGILRIVAPNSEWNTITNNFTKGRMEKNLLLFPKHEYRHPDPETNEVYRTIYRAGNQFTTIVSRPIGLAYKNYETKSTTLKKDLYSATLLAMSERYQMIAKEMKAAGKRKPVNVAIPVSYH